MITRGLSAFRNKRVLLLQGPVGPFFRRLALDLEAAGAQVFKVNLNGGDWLFYRKNAIAFRGGLDTWQGFMEDLLDRERIDVVMLFGDCRAYHRIAHGVARARGLEVGVFEEGYVRPDYVTLERDGVNGFSPLPDQALFYLNRVPSKGVRTDRVGNTFWHAVLWACLYYMAAQLLRPIFPRYRHHRPLTVLEAGPWVRAIWRKALYRFRERGVQEMLVGPMSKQYFLVPLQVHTDAQVHTHSRFDSVEQFIRRVVSSFAANAPAETVLVIKHHPMDRGYSDYTRFLRDLRAEFQLGERLMYIHDQHLPSLLDHARGAVVINSTVGLSALFHKTPLKVCGNAIYDIQGMTYQGRLDDFWQAAENEKVDAELFHRFRSYVIEHTQLNGSFYKRLPIDGSFTGMRWEERWLPGDGERRRVDRGFPARVVPEEREGFQRASNVDVVVATETAANSEVLEVVNK
ncbi:capsular biosynthesis protein [Noviherbaspirillum agri]